jgi:HAMP domain-containing protein
MAIRPHLDALNPGKQQTRRAQKSAAVGAVFWDGFALRVSRRRVKRRSKLILAAQAVDAGELTKVAGDEL